MTTLNITFTETDGNILDEADLDLFKDAVEDLLNTDKLESDNIAAGGIQANNVRGTTFNTAQIRRSVNSYAIYALTEETITDNSLAAAFADASITVAKRAGRSTSADTAGQVLISDPATQSVSTTSTTSVFGASSDFKSTGRLVEISMCGAANGSVSSIAFTPNLAGSTKTGEVLAEIYRNGSHIQTGELYYIDRSGGVAGIEQFPGGFRFFDRPGPGTFNYEIRFRLVTGGDYYIENMVQVVREV